MAYQVGAIGIHADIKVKMYREFDGVLESGIIQTTVGKILFNESIPQDLGFIDRTSNEEKFNLEIEFLVTKKTLGKIIDKCYAVHGPTNTSIMLDKIKSIRISLFINWSRYSINI